MPAASEPSRATTTAAMRWPHSSSGTLTTAHPMMLGWFNSTSLISAGATFSPPRMIVSSLRPSMKR